MPTIPPKVRVVDKTGQPQDANTLPEVGQKDPDSSFPVVMARGVAPFQSYKDIPQTNKTSSDTYNQTVIKILSANPNRRYLRIYNNGTHDVELWSNGKPIIDQPGQIIPHGEILFSQGGVLMESDTCRTSEIWATANDGASGLVILEG